MATSLNASQSQLGDTSSASAMWNDGRPSTTALAYSAILQLSTSLAMSKSGWMACIGQTLMQRAQPVHLYFRRCV